MACSYPDYADLDVSRYDLVYGYYTLGFCRYHRPDCVWITPDQWQSHTDYSWLQRMIDEHLATGKKICIVAWDEDILAPGRSNLSSVLNQYQNEPVYFITQLDQLNQKMYRWQHGITCKILNLPWWHLNDVLTYYAVKKIISTNILPQADHFQYLCMVHNPRSHHKHDLLSYLRSKNLHRYGLITVRDLRDYPLHFRDFVIENPHPPIAKKYNMAAQHKIDNLWISGSVKNFLHIEQTYAMPLVVHPETSPGIFFSTEKSIWPALLGKMYLIYGGPGCMKYMQQFHNLPQTLYADVRFDSIIGNYTKQDYLERLDAMLEDNRYLIQNATEVYRGIEKEVQESRWSLGKNFYDFFIKQLCSIT